MPVTGGCFCGAVRYRIDGGLRNARCCHCSRCRKIFSGASSAYAEVEGFSWTEGEDSLSVFKTHADWGVCFCRLCGSTLAGQHAGEVHGVTLGSVDGDPGVAVQMHIYVGSKAPWDEIGGTAPQYDEGPES